MIAYPNDRKIYGVVFLAAIISCFIAFVNNFPLVYQDTGSYIHSGFEGVVFPDRPIFYGLFIKFFSFSSSLWYVVLAQGILVCYLIYVTLGLFFEGLKREFIFIATVTFLTLCTGFSYNVSILIPDIFSAISILCFINLVLNNGLNKWQNLFIRLLFVFSICTQFSNIAIIMLLFGVFFLYILFKKFRKNLVTLNLKNLVLSFGLFLSCLFIIPAVHYSFDKQFKISGSNHVFIMNHLVETGILDDYLLTNCKDHTYKICAYKDQFGGDFIWSPESPLQKSGGWDANRKEYEIIIKDIITTPRYFLLLVQKGVEYSLKQFFTFNVSVTSSQLLSAPFGQIEWRFKNSLREYISCLQNQSKLNIDYVNFIQQIVVITSIVFLFVVLVTPYLFKKLNFELKAALVFIVVHNILNCIVSSNLSTVHPRYQNRLAWLFPLFAIIVIVKLIEYKKRSSLADNLERDNEREVNHSES